MLSAPCLGGELRLLDAALRLDWLFFLIRAILAILLIFLGFSRDEMPGYHTRVERVAIAGVNDLTIRSLLDRQQYHDPDGVASRLGISSAIWPLFGLLWPSSLQLAALLGRRPVSPAERILEIGCGLAVSSLVAHRRGNDITASDCHPLAEDFLRHNLRLNQLPELTYRHGQWGVDDTRRAEPAPAEWLGARYDLIVASDVLYEPDAPPQIAAFIERHALPEAEVWIVDPNRGYRNAFSRAMAGYGFQLARDKVLGARGTGSQQPAGYKGRLLVYRRHTPA